MFHMITTLKGSACLLGLAAALALATPSVAAPVLSSTTGVKAAVSDHAIDVRWRRGGGIAAGVAAGVLAGAAIGAVTAPRYYGYGYGYGYGPAYGYSYGAYAYDAPVYGYAYGAPAYGVPVYGGPVYYNRAYGYPAQSCGVDGGYGRWDYSQC
jgi:hypothetical protein